MKNGRRDHGLLARCQASRNEEPARLDDCTLAALIGSLERNALASPRRAC
jgi:hypothetical protein